MYRSDTLSLSRRKLNRAWTDPGSSIAARKLLKALILKEIVESPWELQQVTESNPAASVSEA